MTSKISLLRIDARQEDGVAAIRAFLNRLSPDGEVVSDRGRQKTLEVFGEPLTPTQVVQRICHDVRTEGHAAALRYSSVFDGSPPQHEFRVPIELIRQAHQNAEVSYLKTIRRIRDNILAFQRAILHRDQDFQPQTGIRLQQRYVPLRRIGICVPGGAAAYPSTVLMTAVPAMAAGVEQIVVVGPPTKLGAYNPDVLAACHELGIDEVYAIGGAQAVAVMAYGTSEIPAVDKIVGPGNLFVALAKKHVYGHVDIDSIAGPSEVVVIADSTTSARFAAADMLAQAEHSPGSSVLVTWDESLLNEVSLELDQQCSRLERCDLTIEALNNFGAMILVRDADQACQVTDQIAPEHLHIATASPRALLTKIRNAGATFLGPFSPVALGDYAAGPSHVLPTGGTARWASGLSSNSFLRAGSVIEYDEPSLCQIAPEIQTMAEKEGLTAHRESVAIRVSSAKG